MRHEHRSASVVSVCLLPLLGLLAAAVAAQSPTGNLFGSVTDTDGNTLPGVSVTLFASPNKGEFTDEQGQFRFLNLDPGSYRLQASVDGAGVVDYPNVTIAIGRNTTVQVQIDLAVAETLLVTSRSPLLDERKLTQGVHLDQVELEKIPSARDPWAVLHQTPGVLTDRINVGGNESGQQSAFRAQGVSNDQNEWVLDGVAIGIDGGSSTYYDFDQFAEMQFSTGGTDVTKATAGVTVNLVTKRGSNAFRGSARFYNVKSGGYFGGKGRQAQPNVSAADLGSSASLRQCLRDDPDPSCTEFYIGSQTREIEEAGFEAGGALVRDRIWLWGSWGQNDIQKNASSGVANDTILENEAVKLNAQVSSANSLVASWNNGDKQKFGRGASLTRPEATTWNQSGPAASYRFEDNHVFSSNLFLTGMYSFQDLGVTYVTPAGGGLDAPQAVRRADGVWQTNFLQGFNQGPTEEFKVDGSYFFTIGNAPHELKVGGRSRTVENYSDFPWPGGNVFTFHTPNSSFFGAKRGVTPPSELKYFSLWLQDTLSLNNLTLNLGLRYDDQSGVNRAFEVPANPVLPEVLPALDYGGGGKEFSWTHVAPRLGATYAFGGDRSTLVRASFAQFADQLSIDSVNRTNPVGSAYAYFSFDGDGVSNYDGEPLTFAFPNGYDPEDPVALTDPDVTDPGLSPPITSELVLAAEHAIWPEFVVGLTITARNVKDILEIRTLLREADGTVRTLRRSDYVADGVLSGTIDDEHSGGASLDYDVPLFALSSRFDFTGGSLLTNGSRERDYLGAAVTFTKRLSQRWLLRGYVNYGEAEWSVDGAYRQNSDPNPDPSGDDADGQLFLTRSGGGLGGVSFLQSSWTANLNGLVQIAPNRPWGFNLSGSVQARQGYPIPYQAESIRTSDRQRRNIGLVDDFDRFRLDDIATLDLRVEKEFATPSAVNLTFGIDVFNVTNEGTELSRIREVNSSRAYFLSDSLGPRIYRLGVRLGWK